ncbi:MAG: glutamine--tRNA ligase/YqeY domain fusion protein [Myxococcota bacterium]|nr:glutamine--tRNA ligase/YqeY domain fusion protein [Myxococcota bacterium]
MTKVEKEKTSNFVRTMIEKDLANHKYAGVVTRFPPEPNGYLHIGHAKAICVNFGLAEEFGGRCHMRFDDTNPVKEDPEYVESILRDVRWLGFDWGEHLYNASDYFGKFYDFCVALIKDGKAYVCSLTEEEIREYRGTVSEAGKPSPYRDRSVEENLDLLERMRTGEFEDGKHVVRAKGDMSAANMKMRDPLLYRIRNAVHHKTGDAWCIYPMYDYAHCLSDAIEKITHSLCTLEFENNRDLYDFFLEEVGTEKPRPEQTEFARLEVEYIMTSKRKLLKLVTDGHVKGWDDPRMPTIAGMRRRGYTPEAIRDFCERAGVAKANSTVEYSQLEFCIRNDLNQRSPRLMGVLDPLKLVLTNLDKSITVDADLWPHDIPKDGTRCLTLGREIYIDREDFREDAPKGFFRLKPGGEVRLRHGYVIKCDEVVRDASGQITELRCSVDLATLGADPEGRKVKGTIHWVDAATCVDAKVRLYDRLFTDPSPDGHDGRDHMEFLNSDSLIEKTIKVEPHCTSLGAGEHLQLERVGYFFTDPVDHSTASLTLNKTVGLRDSWAKQSTKQVDAKPKPQSAKKAKKGGAAPDQDKRALERVREGQLQSFFEKAVADGVKPALADTLVDAPLLWQLYVAGQGSGFDAGALGAFLVNDVLKLVKDNETTMLTGAQVVEVLEAQQAATINGAGAKKILEALHRESGTVVELIESLGLAQISDAGRLREIVLKVMSEHPSEVADFRSGNKKRRGFLMGQAMKASEGKANPKVLNQVLDQALSGS